MPAREGRDQILCAAIEQGDAVLVRVRVGIRVRVRVGVRVGVRVRVGVGVRV